MKLTVRWSLALGLLVGVALLAVRGHSASSLAADELITTTLYPGWNLVGWIHEDAPIEVAFDQLPALTLIRGDSGRASRAAAPDESRRLHTLQTGHGYWFWIAGDRTIDWQRRYAGSVTQIRRNPGRHLVAWGGPDGTAFDRAVRGVAEAVRLAWRWDAAHQQWHWWAPNTGSTNELASPLNRGDAIGVSFRRSVDWRQPTGILPRVRFLGDVPDAIRNQVIADVRYTTAYFADRFGVEADPKRLEILVYRTLADLIGREPPKSHRIASFAAMQFEPGQPSSVVMAMSEWGPSLIERRTGESINARVILIHEYFHIVQGQLAGRAFSGVPSWLVEGGPTWLQRELERRAGQLDPSPAMQIQEASQLVISEREQIAEDEHDHALGFAATQWLVERAGRDSYFEFWRNMAANGGVRPTWRQAFKTTFGISVSDFYQQFEEWIRRLHPFVEGTVTVPDHIDAELVRVYVTPIEGAFSNLTFETGETFRVAVPANSPSWVMVAVEELGCRGYRADDGSVGPLNAATELDVGIESISGVDIKIPEHFCSAHLRGRLTGPDPNTIARIGLTACTIESLCTTTSVGPDGKFELVAPLPGRYMLELVDSTGTCAAYYREGSTTALRDRASLIAVSEDGREELHIQVPASLCGRAIGGRLLNLPPSGVHSEMVGRVGNRLEMYACPVEGGRCTYATIADDGRFSIPVASPGSYEVKLRPWFQPQVRSPLKCDIYFPGDAQVHEADAAEITWEVPKDFCRWRVEGVLTTPDGNPLADFLIWLCDSASSLMELRCGAGQRTNSDGTFAIWLRYDGAFYLAPGDPYRCRGGRNPAYRLHLEFRGADLNDVRWFLPEDVCMVTSSLKRGENWDPTSPDQPDGAYQ